MFCFWCRDTVLTDGAPLPCGCKNFHNVCLREYLLSCTGSEKDRCPVCKKMYPLLPNEKESLLIYCESNIYTDKRRSCDDVDFLLRLCNISARSCYNIASLKALKNPALAIAILAAAPRLAAVYTPVIPEVLVSLNLMTRKLAIRCVEDRPDCFFILPAKYKTPSLALMAVGANPKIFPEFDHRLRANELVSRVAVRGDGMNLEFVPVPRKEERDVVVAALRQNGLALQHCSEEFKKDDEILKIALTSCPAVVDLISQRHRKKLKIAQTVLKIDGSYIDRFETTKKQGRELALLAVKTTPVAALKLNAKKFKGAWSVALEKQPNLLLEAKCRELSIPSDVYAFGVSRGDPDKLYRSDVAELCIVLGCRFETLEKDEKLLDFYLKFTPLKENLRIKFEETTKGRQRAHLAANLNIANVLGNEKHFSNADVRKLLSRVDADIGLPIFEEEFSTHKLFDDPVLKLKFFGCESVKKSTEMVELLIYGEPRSNFGRIVLQSWFDDLTLAEKKASVNKYPELVFGLRYRRNFLLDAMLSPKSSVSFFFLRDVKEELSHLPRTNLIEILRRHPEYLKLMPSFIRADEDIVVSCVCSLGMQKRDIAKLADVLKSASPVVLKSDKLAACLDDETCAKFMHSKHALKATARLTEKDKQRVRQTSEKKRNDGDYEHCLRLLRGNLNLTLASAKDIPYSLKNAAYNLVDKDSSRGTLNLLLACFGYPSAEQQRQLLLKGRIPAGGAELKLSLSTLRRIVPQDLEAAAQCVEPTKESIRFFVTNRLWSMLRRVPLKNYRQVLAMLSDERSLHSDRRQNLLEASTYLQNTK